MQLAYPWFLVGLAAVAIPVVIHLLQLRRPQRVLFTNTGFIREVELVTTKQRNLQHLLVLFSRVIGLSALVLMFCQPFIPNKENSSLKRVPSGVEVFVDTSPSMQVAGQKYRTLLEASVTEARELGAVYPEVTKFRLLNQAGGASVKSVYLAKLDGLRVNSQGNPFARIASQHMGDGANPLYIFSDFQRNAYNGKVLNQFMADREVYLVPQAAKAVGNVYVDSVWVDDAFIRAQTNINLHVRLRNGGASVVPDCPVKVFLGNRQAAAFRLTVEPGKAVVTEVQVQVGDTQLAQGRVVTEDTPVAFDNTFYFTLQPAAAIRVLEIGNEPVAQRLYSNEPLFSYSFAKPQAINYGVLRQANLVLVSEVVQVEAGLREALAGVAKRGGSVVVVPTAALAGRGTYQQLFKQLGVGAVQWEAPTATPERREVALPNARSAFFQNVFGAQQRTVSMPKVAPVLRWARTGNDVMRLRDGESYLAEFASGEGRVYVFSAPFSRPYSDFVNHALFVPVMYRLAMLSYRNDQLPAYRLSIPAVALTLPTANNAGSAGREEAGLRLVKDSTTLIPVQRVQGREARLEVPVGMDEPGFYQVKRGQEVLTTLAFNIRKEESELAAYSADELRAMAGAAGKNVQVLDGGLNGAALAKLQARQDGQPLWRYFLVLALLSLLAEALLIRFGNRRAAQKPTLAAA